MPVISGTDKSMILLNMNHLGFLIDVANKNYDKDNKIIGNAENQTNNSCERKAYV
ncbi:hypothetical protein D0N43_17970 [Klebsiella aerogenes]|uniref:Uncharacterized protein n=1 Tax=Klebsiella aerogenes (strain ATCC 13048 / DSM 30053 / CCUG 1429 / JCM 1235 / KCTC 2190 / NBRC 13534 / NCIMB 10102 / NCTC 10006 / CDC 819-56) TaxID=1028307 RepID=A0A0H3FQG4_KLEAK|nr:hypothetical protein EAE_08950 [Klebsiella aerogenes KCTC 2190]QEU20393.1 hypothetical protein FOB49_17955 [Klebsiella aerogenes]RFP72557.1 hypothetical protein D0N43_17970 [Klebsiella aerogenes]